MRGEPVADAELARRVGGSRPAVSADDPHQLIPTDRAYTVTVLEPGDRDETIFALLNDAQWEHEAKAAAWRAVTSGLPLDSRSSPSPPPRQPAASRL